VAVRDANNELVAALFLTRSGELPRRDWVASQLGRSDGGVCELLAGRPAAPQPDLGPMVCICHAVAEQMILEAARAGASNVDAIGEATRAGTNCGSCRPAIARLLEEEPVEQAEAAE